MNLPPYITFPVVHGDRVSLRQVLPQDVRALVEISFYDAVQAENVEQALEMQARIDRDYREGQCIHWGIEENSTGNLVGTCGYYRGLDNGVGELGCILLHRYQGMGLMTSAMELAIDFGKQFVGLKRIRAVTSLQNGKAIRLLERLDFIKLQILDGNQFVYELRWPAERDANKCRTR